MRGTKTVLAVMALSAVGTTSIALSVLTHQELSVELRPGGIQLETPAAVEEPDQPPAEQDAGAPAPAPAPDAGSPSTSGGQSAPPASTNEAPAPVTEPEPVAEPDPIETVAPAPATPVTPPAPTGKPENPGNNGQNGNGGQNPNSGSGNPNR